MSSKLKMGSISYILYEYDVAVIVGDIVRYVIILKHNRFMRVMNIPQNYKKTDKRIGLICINPLCVEIDTNLDIRFGTMVSLLDVYKRNADTDEIIELVCPVLGQLIDSSDHITLQRYGVYNIEKYKGTILKYTNYLI